MILATARLATEEAVIRPALPLVHSPGMTEMHMNKMTYREQLLHPNWQKKRLEVLNDAGFECENCGDKETTLNVHHLRYVKGRKVWEYERRELKCLCEPCHRTEHEHRELLDLMLMQANVSLPRVVVLLAGFFEGNMDLDDAPPLARELSQEFDLGILMSILDGQMPDALHRAHQAAGVAHLSPPQQAAVERWRDFAEKLEGSGL